MRVLAVVIVFSLVGCTEPATGDALDSTFEGISLHRASIEFPCAPSALTVVPLGGDAYRVEGCGLFAEYECEYSTAMGELNHWTYVCERASTAVGEPLDAGHD
jgi:hypothetical protein